ncbi:MAG: hypothetical protein ACOYO1_19505 [Bacteroidales bacterium]
MKKLKFIVIIFILTAFFDLCYGQKLNTTITGQIKDNNKSKLLWFQYGGFSDTIYALVSGYIYTGDSLNKSPLDSVSIISYRPDPTDTIAYADNKGYFIIAFCQGTFTILIKKKGYQTIKLNNYYSLPDQISHLEAILIKGEGVVEYDIDREKINK